MVSVPVRMSTTPAADSRQSEEAGSSKGADNRAKEGGGGGKGGRKNEGKKGGGGGMKAGADTKGRGGRKGKQGGAGAKGRKGGKGSSKREGAEEGSRKAEEADEGGDDAEHAASSDEQQQEPDGVEVVLRGSGQVGSRQTRAVCSFVITLEAADRWVVLTLPSQPLSNDGDGLLAVQMLWVPLAALQYHEVLAGDPSFEAKTWTREYRVL